MHLSAGKTVVLTPNGHVPTPAEISTLAGFSVRIADEGDIKVVGVSFGTDEFAIESAMGIMRDGGTEQLERMLPGMPHKQAANLSSRGLFDVANGTCRAHDGPEAVPASLSTGT